MDPDINLVPELTQRGGGIKRLTWRTWQPVDFPLQSLTDGNDATARIAGSPWFTFANVFNYTNQHTMPPSLVWNFDLGGAFSVHRVRFYPRPELRVRTGNDPDPNTYWRYSFRGDEITRFDLSGQPLDQDSYAGLASGERAGIRYDTSHWTPWSPPQPASGPDPLTI